MTTTKPDEFYGYPMFNDIINPILRTWNRLNIFYNIKELVGGGLATKYAEQLDHDDKVAFLKMGRYVETNGYENTRREIFRKLQ